MNVDCKIYTGSSSFDTMSSYNVDQCTPIFQMLDAVPRGPVPETERAAAGHVFPLPDIAEHVQQRPHRLHQQADQD
jgi:hypothetical protein